MDTACFWCEKPANVIFSGGIAAHVDCMQAFKDAVMNLIYREMGDFKEKHVILCFREKEK